MAEVITVSALNRYVKTLLDANDALFDLALRGEIANFVQNARSGHAISSGWISRESTLVSFRVLFSATLISFMLNTSVPFQIYLRRGSNRQSRKGRKSLQRAASSPLPIAYYL